jgi:metallo-beta-lactamase family protein
MKAKIKFLGGAQSVTGSRFLLEIDDFKVLIDCGLFQGLKDLRLRNWSDFPVSPRQIDAVILTHAHIDHSGYLPKLVKEGFNGPIYCTYPTKDLVQILLADSAKLQTEESEFASKKGYSKHEKPEPLYKIEDAEKVTPMLQAFGFEETVKIHDHISFSFYNAGHILGAAIVKMTIKGQNQEKKLVFSGDLGRNIDPILNPPKQLPKADILFLESTYGNRAVENQRPEDELAHAINQTYNQGGVAVLSAFAVGRTQLLLFHLHRLQAKGKIPNIPIYIDSPMAIDVTHLYQKYPQYHKLGPILEEAGCNPFASKNLHYYQSQESSMSLNKLTGDAIIISASGMATGGRILHHLYNRLPNENDSIIFTGYQAEGTRGRSLLSGEKSVKIYGISVPVKARIYSIKGLSAHADQGELIAWAEGFEEKPKMTFLVHGEAEASQELADLLKNQLKWQTLVPEYLESFELFDGI